MNGMNGENGKDGVAVRYVGATSAMFDGAQGVLTYNNACHGDFPGSRMCTSVEVMETTPYIGGSFPSAYVRPVIVGQNSDGVPFDASGLPEQPTLGPSLSCRGYNDAIAARGLIVDSLGRFSSVVCSLERPVACCAPAEPTQ
jgi:hypothetical protein